MTADYLTPEERKWMEEATPQVGITDTKNVRILALAERLNDARRQRIRCRAVLDALDGGES